MKVSLKLKSGVLISVECEEAIVPLGSDTENIACSMINGGELVVIRYGDGYPSGGECVWSELIGESD